jgi:hypothetical protein
MLNRRVATMTASQIELDILSGNFDDSLNKYRREPLPSGEVITLGISILDGLPSFGGGGATVAAYC